MNYMSLFALCSLMVLIPSCGRRDGGAAQVEAQEDMPAAEGAVEIQEEVVETKAPRTARAPMSDKENLEELEEAELVEVMANK